MLGATRAIERAHRLTTSDVVAGLVHVRGRALVNENVGYSPLWQVTCLACSVEIRRVVVSDQIARKLATGRDVGINNPAQKMRCVYEKNHVPFLIEDQSGLVLIRPSEKTEFFLRKINEVEFGLCAPLSAKLRQRVDAHPSWARLIDRNPFTAFEISEAVLQPDSPVTAIGTVVDVTEGRGARGRKQCVLSDGDEPLRIFYGRAEEFLDKNKPTLECKLEERLNKLLGFLGF